MGAGSYSRGWGAIDDHDDQVDSSSGDGSRMGKEERMMKFRFSIPTPEGRDKQPNLVPGSPAVKRVLILDDDPFCIHEHALYNFHGAWKILDSFSAICLQKNGLYEKGCPMCAKNGGNNYPSFVGYFPVIDMGQVEYIGGDVRLHHEYWEDKDGNRHERCFEMKLLGAKHGSRDKPGVLKTLHLQSDRRNGLKGTVWDVTRTGRKAAQVGDAWEFVDKIRQEDFAPYLKRFGAESEDLDLEIPELYVKGGDVGSGMFNIDPVDYYGKLARIVGWGTGDSTMRSDPQVSGAGFVVDEDDDIPF